MKGESSLELKLASVVSDNKKCFLKYVNSKRRSKENIGPILVEDGHLTSRDEEKAEAFNSIFASAFSHTDRPWAAWSPENYRELQRTKVVGTAIFHLWALKL